ncbi:MAG: diaminopimelate decarboxylase [Planctomycetota bacterium]|nr:diaminopimelate decarboxylase [Planctomycetota bacterium]
MDHFTYESGVLHADGVSVERIADEFGTPTYVYSAETIRNHVHGLTAAFAALRPTICYAVKACSNLEILRLIGSLGLGMDVVSGGELERAWLAGVPMSRIVFAGVGKGDDEIRAALDGRFSPLCNTSVIRDGAPGRDAAALASRGPVACFNVESEEELEVLAAIAAEVFQNSGQRAVAALRVNPDVDAHTHAYTTTGKAENKFGVPIEHAASIFKRFGPGSEHAASLDLCGVHMHLGSPIYTTAPYVEAIKKLLSLLDALAAQGTPAKNLDIGGGFGADYQTGRTPSFAQYAQAIVPLLKDRVDAGLKIVMEPGRTIVANAGVLLTRVRYVKRGSAKTFLVCDAGMNALIRPSLYSAFHFIWPVRVTHEFLPPRREERMPMPSLTPCDVVGPICESGDFLAKDRPLPPVKRGDVLAVFSAGAYGMSMASTYNDQPLPAEVLVTGETAELIRPRGTIAEHVRHELD